MSLSAHTDKGTDFPRDPKGFLSRVYPWLLNSGRHLLITIILLVHL